MRIASAFLFILMTLYLNETSAQFVLDAPYILQKEAMHSPEPTSLNHLEYEMFDMSPEKFKKHSELFEYGNLLYKSSYIYMEPEYYMVKVMRSFRLKDNEQFSSSIPKVYYELNSDSTAYEAYDTYYKGSRKMLGKEELSFLNFQLPRELRRAVGLNLKEIENDSARYTYKQHALESLEHMIEMGTEINYIYQDETGVIRENDDIRVLRFRTIPFVEMLLRSVIEGYATPYEDSDYKWPWTRNEFIAVIDTAFDPMRRPRKYSRANYKIADEIIDGIKGIRIKEYWHIDPLSGKLMSTIMGIGAIGTDTVPGNELFWLYYPELRYAIHYNYTYLRDSLTDYEYLLDQHLFEGRLDSYEQGYSYSKEKEDGSFAVKLDPLISLKMQEETDAYYQKENNKGKTTHSSRYGLKKLELSYKEGTANGKVREYWDNGNVSFEGKMKDGLCEGKFSFYHENGNLKAIRNYKEGYLTGEQINYYESNSQVYMKYQTEFDENIEVERFYNDGELMEKGKFDRGLLIGTWYYKIRLPQETVNLIRSHYLTLNEYPVKYGEDFIQYKVLYYEQEEFKEWCVPNYYRGRSIDRCMGRRIIE